jgi:hypothetical protein
MTYQLVDGRYHVPIADFGNHMITRGWDIIGHSQVGDGYIGGHSPNSHHYSDNAIDLRWKNNQHGDFGPDGKTSWLDHTKNTGSMLAGSGAELFYPGSDPVGGHDSHIHLAGHGGIIKLTPEQYNHFGFKPPETPQQPDGTPQRVEAVTRAKEYSKMNKAEMNSAYDDLRKSDPAKAAIEGKKMHRAFFNK